MSQELLEKIATNTSTKESYSIVVSGAETRINTKFNPPLHLNPTKEYEVALMNLETYFSFPNIDESNNIFKYSSDAGRTWKEINFPKGCYEITQINNFIQSQMRANRDFGEEEIISIGANTATLRSLLNITKDTYQVDFRGNNTLRTLLGFNAKIYKRGVNESENIVNIMSINSILVNLDIVSSSYVNGISLPVIYSFFPTENVGAKIIEKPQNLIYLPITLNKIPNIITTLTDQNGKQLDLRGEVLTMRFHLRQK